MKRKRNAHQRARFLEQLEARQCLSSVGWDGPGQGSAELKYYIDDNIPANLSHAEVEQAIETALDAWSDVVDITFTQTTTPNQRDALDFEFARIDGNNGTLAQAYFPDDVNRSRIAGDVQFDSAETWELGIARGGSAFDLTLVAVHEIGHSLGIDHLHSHDSVLNARVSPYASFNQLASADINAARQLYAATPTTPPPSALPTALPSSNTLSPTTDPLVNSGLKNNGPHETTPTMQTETQPTNQENSIDPPRTQNRWFGRFNRWNWRSNRNANNFELTERGSQDTGVNQTATPRWVVFRFGNWSWGWKV